MQIELRHRHWLSIVALSLPCYVYGLPVVAQGYPSKPIRLVLPFPPGGGVDTVDRIVDQNFAAQLGQPFVPENRAGSAATSVRNTRSGEFGLVLARYGRVRLWQPIGQRLGRTRQACTSDHALVILL